MESSVVSRQWLDMTQAARTAYQTLAQSSNAQRSAALVAAAKALRGKTAEILAANAKDMSAGEAKGLTPALLDRLKLDALRVESMAKGLEDIATLPDPLGKVQADWQRPNGLHITRKSIPLGVIGIIYESRPNVTADAGGLCLKSGNAAILRGGSESFHSSHAILQALHQGLREAGLPEAAIQLIPDTDRAWVSAMLQATGQIDVIIPRGGKSLNARVQEESRVPTLLHLEGNCHTYVHAQADLAKAAKLLVNAKMRRTGICGATESLIIDKAILAQVLPLLVAALQEAGCTDIRADEAARSINPTLTLATEDDWGTEYLSAAISIKTVTDINEAIRHINHYGSHHTDCIVTEDSTAAALFQQQVDSAIVMHNTSTQFADGGEFGMGAEIGIATGRMHARGPVGAEQLTTYKYIVNSDGAVRG